MRKNKNQIMYNFPNCKYANMISRGGSREGRDIYEGELKVTILWYLSNNNCFLLLSYACVCSTQDPPLNCAQNIIRVKKRIFFVSKD